MTMHAKDPISWLTHFIGFIMAIIATPFIIVNAHIDNVGITFMVAVIIFMLNMMVLYAASSIYHYFNISEKVNLILKRIDHCSIFLLIAGTYTPVCIIGIGEKSYPMLITVWILAILGIIFKLFWVTCPKWVSSVMYIGLGWVVIFNIKSVFVSLSTAQFIWLLTGGIFYTVGGVIYSLKPKIFKKEELTGFGNHELFHIFVMLGTVCHFICCLLLV